MTKRSTSHHSHTRKIWFIASCSGRWPGRVYLWAAAAFSER